MNDEIKELALSYFRVIGSDIVENRGLYDIRLPEKYHTYFESAELSITFDRNVASRCGCHLVIPGSNILSRIITNCMQKGPISDRTTTGSDGRLAIRYHFFVDFSGTSNMSRLDHVDVRLDTNSPADSTSLMGKKIDRKDVTPSYLAALDELKTAHAASKEAFLAEANRKFQHDFELFAGKYDVQIRELDDSINKKEEACDDPEEMQRFRFSTVERIKELEKEKTRLVDVLQEKHRVLLEYNLVACEIIRV